jgi:hypothetical protein
VERLLDGDGPVWHRWDGDPNHLLQCIQTAAEKEFSSADSPGPRHLQRLRRVRLLWLLDRLAPETAHERFQQYLRSPLGIYAWGRRLPPESRDALFEIPLPEPGKDLSREWYLSAAIYAWCDSTPDDQLATLLTWHERWGPLLDRHEICWLPSPEVEFYRRCIDREVLVAGLMGTLAAGAAFAGDSDPIRHELGREIGFAALRLRLEDAASQDPCGEEGPFDTAEEWGSWFQATLARPAFAHLEEFRRDMFLAQSLWIWRHGESNWRRLLDYALMTQDCRVFERLAKIVPPDELEAWDDVVLNQATDHGEMRAYCRWLAPQYAELLRTHFDHPDRDWGACAYQNYLWKTPEPILQHAFRRSQYLPGWQVELLDRRLYAPEAVRPAAIVEDTQTVEGDLRLEDPFNHRSF